jgi:methyl-accepting chemotaxis protein
MPFNTHIYYDFIYPTPVITGISQPKVYFRANGELHVITNQTNTIGGSTKMVQSYQNKTAQPNNNVNQIPTVKGKRNGKLVKGILLGAVVGGAVAMMDKNTRKKITNGTNSMKDSTMDMVSKVKDNPSGVMNDWQDRIKSASSVLKEAINDAQKLYEKVNGDVIDQVNQVKEDSTEIIATTKEAAEDLKDIGSKVKEAGEEVTSESSQTSSVSTSTSSSGNDNIHSTNKPSNVPGQVGS